MFDDGCKDEEEKKEETPMDAVIKQTASLYAVVDGRGNMNAGVVSCVNSNVEVDDNAKVNPGGLSNISSSSR